MTTPRQLITTIHETPEGSGTPERQWVTLLWDDPVTPFVVVTRALQRLLELDELDAEHLAWQVHDSGRVAVFSGTYEKAERYAVSLQAAGLQATVGEA